MGGAGRIRLRRVGQLAAAVDGRPGREQRGVVVAGDDEGFVLVGDGQQGLEAAQGAIGAPVLGQRHGGALQVALMGLQFGFEALEQGRPHQLLTLVVAGFIRYVIVTD